MMHLQSEFPIDADRIYVTGQSLGGKGAWHFALAYPEVPAAVVPMAGFYSDSATVPSNICDMASIPTWAFHGAQDGLVPLEWEQALVDALTECGGDVQFTVYPGGGHSDAFDRGYADPALYVWLLEQHR
jgi:predicted peptidase